LLCPVFAAEPLRVFVSVAPIKTFVEKVGGAHVVVTTLVRPGESPQTFDPSPQQIAALARAQLYVRVNVPFEQVWMPRIRAANPRMVVLDATADIEPRALSAHEGHGDHPHELDPHVWTSPLLARDIARSIRDQLIALDPANADDFKRAYAAFADELVALDRDIRQWLAPLRSRRFMVYHPAWGYFADTYELTQVPIEQAGKEPGAQSLVALIRQARRDKVQVVFVQPQFDRRLAGRVAAAIGGRVVAVDPLAADYIANLRRVAQQFVLAMQESG
jgi:zinc transport system substrate-binding protein